MLQYIILVTLGITEIIDLNQQQGITLSMVQRVNSSVIFVMVILTPRKGVSTFMATSTGIHCMALSLI